MTDEADAPCFVKWTDSSDVANAGTRVYRIPVAINTTQSQTPLDILASSIPRGEAEIDSLESFNEVPLAESVDYQAQPHPHHLSARFS